MQMLASKLVRLALVIPPRLRPAILGALVIAFLFGLRAAIAFPAARARGESGLDLLLALCAATGAAFVGGLLFGLTRPILRGHGFPGRILSGIVTVWGYLGSLLLASPLVFESSAIPSDAAGWLSWASLATVIGAFGGPILFAEDGCARPSIDRARPSIVPLLHEDGVHRAWLVSGWVRSALTRELLERVAEVTGCELDREEAGRTADSLAERRSGGPSEVELELRGAGWVPVRLAREPRGWVCFQVLLHGVEEIRAERVGAELSAVSGDPFAG